MSDVDTVVRAEAARIIEGMKNRDLAVMLADAVLDGKLVSWNQAHIDYANQQTGCHVTLDDISFARMLSANEERTANNTEIDQIVSKYTYGQKKSEDDVNRLKFLFERNRIIQKGLAERYKNLSAFQPA